MFQNLDSRSQQLTAFLLEVHQLICWWNLSWPLMWGQLPRGFSKAQSERERQTLAVIGERGVRTYHELREIWQHSLVEHLHRRFRDFTFNLVRGMRKEMRLDWVGQFLKELKAKIRREPWDGSLPVTSSAFIMKYGWSTKNSMHKSHVNKNCVKQNPVNWHDCNLD